MSTIAQNLQKIRTVKSNIATAINGKGGSITSSTPFADYPDEIGNLTPKQGGYLGSHVDENGIWHKPVDWPDIESLPIPEGTNTIYLLFGNHVNGESFAWFVVNRISGTTKSHKIDIGHISNGEFIVDENVYSGGASCTVNHWLEDKQDDYTIYRVTGDLLDLVYFQTSGTTTINGKTYSKARSTCLMRYGRGPTLSRPYCGNYYIESDNIIDLGKNSTWRGSFESASGYQYCYSLQRWRHTGWKVANRATTYYNTFMYCISLSDIDPDLSGWVTTNTTNIAGMFQHCYSLPYIDVSNWNTSQVTAVNSTFNQCYNLRKIDGLSTWTNLSNITNATGMFSTCAKLEGDLDLENFAITNKCTTFASMFSNCRNITSISIKGWDLSGATSMNQFCSTCVRLKHIDFSNVTPISSTCTNCAQMFYCCYNLDEVVFNNWDFSGLATVGVTGYICTYCLSAKKVEFKNCDWPTTLTGSSTSISTCPVGYLYTASYLDFSSIDASLYQQAGGFYTYFIGSANYLVEEFYPPQHMKLAFSIAASTSLSHDSIVRIFNNLDTVTGTVKLTMGTVNLSKVSADEIAIATNKGWTVSAS